MPTTLERLARVLGRILFFCFHVFFLPLVILPSSLLTPSLPHLLLFYFISFYFILFHFIFSIIFSLYLYLIMKDMTNLFSALLLFPVSRNSIWVEILGIPFERAIKYPSWCMGVHEKGRGWERGKVDTEERSRVRPRVLWQRIIYHRWAGVVVFISLSSHMLTWWVKWSVDGTLLHSITN